MNSIDALIDEMMLLEHIELTWQRQGNYDLTSFSVNNVKYLVQIHMLPSISNLSMPEFDQKKIGEVSFSVMKDDITTDSSFSNQPESQKSSTMVYSTVLHSVAAKFKEYDVFFFEVFRRHSKDDMTYEKKMHLYQSLVSRIKSLTKFHYYEKKSSTESIIIVSKVKLSEESERKYNLIHPLKEAMIAVGLDVSGFNL